MWVVEKNLSKKRYHLHWISVFSLCRECERAKLEIPNLSALDAPDYFLLITESIALIAAVRPSEAFALSGVPPPAMVDLNVSIPPAISG